MHYYLYKITNLKNGKYYIGRRTSKEPPDVDPYMGSGKILKQAMKKHKDFKKDIIETYNSQEELNRAELEIITAEMINDPQCYNLAEGGHGGYTYYQERKFSHTEETKKKISNANKGRARPDARHNMYETGLNKYWLGKKRTEEDRAKKSIAAKNNASNPFRNIVKCNVCGKEGQLPNMRRWHFNNCKLLENS